MQRTTRRRQYDTAPRPIGQSFWLLSTMMIAVVIVMMMGEAFSAASGSANRPSYSGQQLLDLANDSATTTTSLPSASTPSTMATPAPAAPATTDFSASSDNGSTTTSTVAAGEVPTSSSTETKTETDTEVPTDALADTVADESDPHSVESRGEAALATISYPWEQLLPEWEIVFLPEKSGLYGLTMVPERKIEIYVRKHQSVALLAHVIAHELGHAVDVSLNDGPDRRRWEAARGLTSAPWWPGSGATDFSTGAGDFAESFAAWQVGDSSFRSKLGGAPTTEQIELLAELSAG